MPVRPGDEFIALLVRTIRPEQLAPPPGTVLADDDLAAAFGLDEPPRPPWSRVDGHLFLMVERPGPFVAPDCLNLSFAGGQPAETALVLVRTEGGWRYQGVGRRADSAPRWTVPELDFDSWRRLGQGRSASRRLKKTWPQQGAT